MQKIYPAIIFLTIGLAASPQLRADGDPDQSSPKAAAKSFWTAVDQGDSDTAKKLCKYDEKQGKWIDAFCAMCDGFRKLHESEVKRFGADSKVFTDHTPGYYAAQAVEKATATETGDTAKITVSGQKASGTNLVKEDGKWMLDLKQTMKADLTTSTAVSQAWATSAREISKKMDDGSYTTAKDAETAFKDELKKSMPKPPAAAPKN